MITTSQQYEIRVQIMLELALLLIHGTCMRLIGWVMQWNTKKKDENKWIIEVEFLAKAS